jgi:5-methylcytosine-specific restriction endonuclease McrA
MTSLKKLQANRKNAFLGGVAFAQKMREQYQQNPTYCKHCQSQLPQSKQANSFCSQSCAATYNNTGRQKAKRYKCLQCDTQIYKGKFCSSKCGGEHRKKFKTPEEALVYKRRRGREISANYRAKLRNQTPPDADRKAIREFYTNCPDGFEVDHIIPISKGGAHTLENLQYLLASENRRKSNRIL